MAGMLEQATNPSPGPGPQTPPTESPGAGTPPLGGAGGPGQPPPEQAPPGGQVPPAEQLVAEAVQRIYGENFDQMVLMFENNGEEDFARSMGITVNAAIDYLEQQYGPIGHEAAAKVGTELFFRLLEDFIVKGLMPDVPMEQIQDAIPAIMMMYADERPDVTKEDIQMVMQQVVQETGAQPTPADPNAPLSTGPGPEPSGSPVPPGVTV